MCGIAGFTGHCDADLLAKFQEALHHRGPDGRGMFCNSDVGLSNNRLAVIDLPGGDQPIFNEDGACAIVFNGEIYNYRELRRQLESRHKFRTDSDTEVIVHLYEEHGTDAPKYLRGDFAFCIWDSRNRSCFLSRDPIGVKPLFYTTTAAGALVFSSEIRALLRHPGVQTGLDPQAIDEYFAFLYVAAPKTIFSHVRKLGPGENLVWKDGMVRTWKYWNIPQVSERRPDPRELHEVALNLLRQSVQRRLIADVPVGAFLSGGLDSSLIVALASEKVSGIHTFSIGYGEPDFDELKYARLVSERFGTSHHESVIRPDARSLLDDVIAATDEPIADSSTIPTFLVAREARRFVKVALSGIGGDEMFFGYPRYAGARLSEAIPGPFRPALSYLTRFWSSQPSGRDIGGRISRFGRELKNDVDARYIGWTTLMDADGRRKLLPGFSQYSGENDRIRLDVLRKGPGQSLDRIFHYDLSRYVASDLLPLCDNMTMAQSLEVRVPFCDVDLASSMAGIAATARFPGYRLKPILREIAAQYLPPDILSRKKQGFMIPIGKWFRQDLKEYLYDQLTPVAMPAFIDARRMRVLLNEHSSGRSNHTHAIWAVLLLSRWLKENAWT